MRVGYGRNISTLIYPVSWSKRHNFFEKNFYGALQTCRCVFQPGPAGLNFNCVGIRWGGGTTTPPRGELLMSTRPRVHQKMPESRIKSAFEGFSGGLVHPKRPDGGRKVDANKSPPCLFDKAGGFML